MSGSAATLGQGHGAEVTKRDFLKPVTGAAIGGAAFAWSLIDSANPRQDALARPAVEVDPSNIAPASAITARRQDKPFFAHHRTLPEIHAAERVPLPLLVDPQADQARVQSRHAQWIAPIGIGTKPGRVPLGNRPSDPRGEWAGRHRSQHDTSGRVRYGPAPDKPALPPYAFDTDTKIKIG